MSSYGETKRGGSYGVNVSIDEQIKFKKENNLDFIDMYIPLPNGNTNPCEFGNKCGWESEQLTYWENEEGNHGWCCKSCGRVHQWG